DARSGTGWNGIAAYDIASPATDAAREITLDAQNTSPHDMTGDGNILYVLNTGNQHIYAYRASDGARVSAADFTGATLRAAGNAAPRAIAVSGPIMYVVDVADDRVYAYSMSTRQAVPSADIADASMRSDFLPLCMEAVKGELWLYGYDNDNGRDGGHFIVISSKRAVAGTNKDPYLPDPANDLDPRYWGVATAGELAYFLEARTGNPRIYAHKLADGPVLETNGEAWGSGIYSLVVAGNNAPRGIWTDGLTMFCVDQTDRKIYAYPLPNGGGTGGGAAPPPPVVSPPAIPTGLSLTTGNRSLVASWTASARAETYELQYRTGQNNWTMVSSLRSTSYTIMGLANGTTYQVQVRARSSAGVSSWTGSATGTPRAAAPTVLAAPAGLASSGVSSSGFTFTWNAVPNASGYEVRLGTGSWIDKGTSRSHAFTGLSASTAYTAQVRALGTGAYSTSASASLAVRTSASARTGVPGPVLNLLVAASQTAGRLDVSWDAPTTGGVATSYLLRHSTVPPAQTVNIPGITGTSRALTGLASGTTYVVSVFAVNSTGTGIAQTHRPVAAP
ncbi:MAG: fibronectin type III domain-containing protein, partial [Acidobacteria bacterium]|nr:fibronectin type III domain-containing protein [Acidobacteriota bacterium]